MLWAIIGKTAAELIESRSNPGAPNMGLTSWRGTIVRTQDLAIAKNYLKKPDALAADEEDLKELEEIEERLLKNKTDDE